MVKKPFWKIMTIYDTPFLVKEWLSNTLIPKNVKCGIFVKGVWPFDRDTFTEEDLSLSVMTDHSFQDNKTLKASVSQILALKTRIYMLQTVLNIRLKHRPFSFNLQCVRPVEIKPFPKAETLRQHRID
jgi:hypothetical protein